MHNIVRVDVARNQQPPAAVDVALAGRGAPPFIAADAGWAGPAGRPCCSFEALSTAATGVAATAAQGWVCDGARLRVTCVPSCVRLPDVRARA